MQRGFPSALLTLLRCSTDGADLRWKAEPAEPFVAEGAAACVRCTRAYPVLNGVLSLLESADTLHPESAKEMEVRDERNQALLAGTRREWKTDFTDAVEVAPTLAAVGVGQSMVVAELGCGPGRYTLALAEHAGAVVAIDFSLPGLLVLRNKLAPDAQVALVQADVTRPYAGPAVFDRVLSTLHSNLPGPDHRAATLRLVSAALKDTGLAVISMHHYCAVDLLSGVPAEGRYPDSGIYRYYMKKNEAAREMAPFFERVDFRCVLVAMPGMPSAAVSRTIARIPLLRSAVGRLFLGVGTRPRRAQAGEGLQAAHTRIAPATIGGEPARDHARRGTPAVEASR